MLDHTLERRALSARARSVSLATVVVTALTVTALTAAQQFSSLTGSIVDPTNGLLPGVTLVLTNNQTKAKYEIQSDRNGRYEFVGLPPGSYTLETKLPGFATFRGTITVAGPAVQQDMVLSVGTLQETITIVGSDTAEQLTPEQLRAAEERRATDESKLAQFRAKRAEALARCPPAAARTAAGIGGNLRTPAKLRDVKPRFPERLRGSEGDVVLQATIDTSGRVNAINVVSTPHPDFAESAIEAVRQWEFDATLLNCTPIDTQMTVTVHYRWK